MVSVDGDTDLDSQNASVVDPAVQSIDLLAARKDSSLGASMHEESVASLTRKHSEDRVCGERLRRAFGDAISFTFKLR